MTAPETSYCSRNSLDQGAPSRHAALIGVVNGARNFPTYGAGKFPRRRARRSAVRVIGASILRRPASAFEGWRYRTCRRVLPGADIFGQQIGVLAQTVAGTCDFDDDGVVKKSVQQGCRDHGVPEDVAPFRKTAI